MTPHENPHESRDLPPRTFPIPILGCTARVEFFRYSNGWLCVTLRDVETGEPLGRLSVVPEGAPEPPKGRFWAKTWDENELIVPASLASGHFRRIEPLQLWPCGYVAAELWEIVPRSEVGGAA